MLYKCAKHEYIDYLETLEVYYLVILRFLHKAHIIHNLPKMFFSRNPAGQFSSFKADWWKMEEMCCD